MTAKADATALFFCILELRKNEIRHLNCEKDKRNVQPKIDELFAEKIIQAEDSYLR